MKYSLRFEASMNQVCSALHKIGFDKVVTDEYAKKESAKQASSKRR